MIQLRIFFLITIIILSFITILVSQGISSICESSWPIESNSTDQYNNYSTYTRFLDGIGGVCLTQNINQDGNFVFVWKKNSDDKYGGLSVEKDGSYVDITSRSLPNHWQECTLSDVKMGDRLTWKFWFTGPGRHQAWISFPTLLNINNTTPEQPEIVPGLHQVIITNMSDLQEHVEDPNDLMGVTLLLDDGPYSGNLIINASNFTLKPNDGRKGEIDCPENNKDTIKLDKTSHVTISKLNLSGYLCGISLEGSTNCVIEGNTIDAIDGCGIYLGNLSKGNTISKNNITSRGHSDDQSIFIYHSDYNEITCNNIHCAQSAHYYLEGSYSNRLSIRPDDRFDIGPHYYMLNSQNYIFSEKITDNHWVQIPGNSITSYVLIGDNSWRCCL